MYKYLVKNGTAIAMIAGTVISILFLVFAVLGLKSAGYESGTDLTTVDTTNLSAFDFGLYTTFLLIIIAVIAFLISSIVDIFVNIKTSKKMVFALIGIVILFVIFYSMGKFDTGGSWDVLNRDNHITEGVSKFVSAGVMTTFVLTILAAIALVYAEVVNMFR